MKNRAANITGFISLGLWAALNLYFFFGEAAISFTRVANWPLFIGLTIASFLAPYLFVLGIQKLIGLIRTKPDNPGLNDQ